jgi:hypothetical protein
MTPDLASTQPPVVFCHRWLREIDRSSPSIAVVKNKWSCASFFFISSWLGDLLSTGENFLNFTVKTSYREVKTTV